MTDRVRPYRDEDSPSEVAAQAIGQLAVIMQRIREGMIGTIQALSVPEDVMDVLKIKIVDDNHFMDRPGFSFSQLTHPAILGVPLVQGPLGVLVGPIHATEPRVDPQEMLDSLTKSVTDHLSQAVNDHTAGGTA